MSLDVFHGEYLFSDLTRDDTIEVDEGNSVSEVVVSDGHTVRDTDTEVTIAKHAESVCGECWRISCGLYWTYMARASFWDHRVAFTGITKIQLLTKSFFILKCWKGEGA